MSIAALCTAVCSPDVLVLHYKTLRCSSGLSCTPGALVWFRNAHATHTKYTRLEPALRDSVSKQSTYLCDHIKYIFLRFYTADVSAWHAGLTAWCGAASSSSLAASRRWQPLPCRLPSTAHSPQPGFYVMKLMRCAASVGQLHLRCKAGCWRIRGTNSMCSRCAERAGRDIM